MLDYIKDGFPRTPRFMPFRLWRALLRVRCAFGSHPHRMAWYRGQPLRLDSDECAVCGGDAR